MQRLRVLNCEGSFNGVKFKPMIMQRLRELSCEGSADSVIHTMTLDIRF